MKLTVVLAVLIGMLVLACSTAAPAPVEPTPNIDATVEARLAQERAVDATVEARLKEEKASQPKAQVQPTNTQPTNTPPLVPTSTSVPTPFEWPNPPTGQRELMLSSTSGSAGDEVTAIGRGFAKIKAYAALWIDSNDNGLIDDGEHVIDWGNIETPRGEFSHTFTIDSNFQGTSSVNIQDAGGVSVNTAMNPTFTVPGTYATPVPTPTAVPNPTSVPTPTPRPIPTPTPRPMPTLEPCDDRSAPPQVFVGAVQANGQSAPDGTEVSAWVDDVEVARTYASGGEFNILIDVCREGSKRLSGARVSFKIGGKWAAESGVLQQGGADVLNLTETTGIPTPTPVPTPTPTIIPTPTPVPLPLLEAFSRQIGCTGGIWNGPCYAFFWRLMNSSDETVTLKSASVRISSGNLLGEFTVDDGVIEPGGSYTFNSTFTAHIYTADDVNAFKTEWIIDTQSRGTIVCNLEPNYSVCKPY